MWDPAQEPRDESLGHPPRYGAVIDADRPEDVAATRRAASGFGAAPRGARGRPSADTRPPGRPHHGRTLADTVQDYIERYGWRAYALPVLVIVTIASLLTAGGGSGAEPKGGAAAAANDVRGPGDQAPPAAPGDIALKSDQPGADSRDTPLSGAALPSGADYTAKGTGTFRMLKGTGPVVGRGELRRYSIEVENGVTGIDLAQFATLVQTTLADRRSWAGHGDVRLQRVDSGPIDFHVSLTSSLTVRTLCGYDLPIETSCFVPAGSVPGVDVNRVVINNARWVRGDAAYIGDLEAYRTYLINHEDGHALGHQHAHQCLPDGLAPVMMQQTIGLRASATGEMCRANPWPYPSGVRGAPGAEQPDTAGPGLNN